MMNDDDDIMIRERAPSFGESFLLDGPTNQEQTSSQDESSKATVADPCPQLKTRRLNSSSSKRRRENARGYVGQAGFSNTEVLDTSGGEDNAFSALATMLKYQDDGRQEESPDRNRPLPPDAETGSPSSLSSVSASLDGGREPFTKASASASDFPIPCPDIEDESYNTRNDLLSKPRNTKISLSFEDKAKANRSRKRMKKSTTSQNFQSIVGSRPKHWDRAATVMPTLRRQRFPQANSRQRRDMVTAAVSGSFRHPKADHLRQTPSPKRSLIPSFLPKPTVAATRDAIRETQNGCSPNHKLASLRPSSANGGLSPLGSPPERKSQQKKGPVAKRLQSLRDEARGDFLRLQSGQYPFSLKKSDRNDPRNRATTICDLTILGTPIGTGKLSTALSFIHNWEIPYQKADASDPHGLAWVAFAAETTRHSNLVPGSELRIYNAIAVAVEGNIPFMVFCTQLSEPYPSQHLKELSKICLRVNTNKTASDSTT